jgi:hypothetical protein
MPTQVKSTIHNFSSQVKIGPSENISATFERDPSLKHLPLRDITKQACLSDELMKEFTYDRTQTSSETDVKEFSLCLN